MPTSRINNLAKHKLKCIIINALKEFTTYNYDSASFNRIIRNSGVSKGLMYYYFNSKDDLFQLVLNNIVQDLKESINPRVEFDDASEFWREIGRLLDIVFTCFEKDIYCRKFIHRILGHSGAMDLTPAAHLITGLNSWLQDFLTVGQISRAIRTDLPLPLLANVVWNIWGNCMDWMFYGDKMVSKANQNIDPARLMLDFWHRALSPKRDEKQELL